MLRIFSSAALAGAVLLTSAFGTSAVKTTAQACAKAQKELAAAQAAMSVAIRNADQAGARYHACKQRKKTCNAERAAYEKAVTARKAAIDAYNFAAARVKRACSR